MKVEAINLFASALGRLSNKFGPFEERFEGTLITNDRDYQTIVSKLSGINPEHIGLQVGMFIGSGGVLSILPDASFDIAMIVDKNKAVLDFNHLLASIVLSSKSPFEILKKLKTAELQQTEPTIQKIVDLYGDLKLIFDFIALERREFGLYHWRELKRFPKTKKALETIPIVYVAANITNPDFTRRLSAVCIRHKAEITFANFSNIHEWIEPETMNSVKRWPFSDNPQIMYSSQGSWFEGWPIVHLADSVDAYIEASKRDRRPNLHLGMGLYKIK